MWGRQDAVALPPLPWHIYLLDGFLECSHFVNKRCTLYENNVFIIKLFNFYFYIYLLTFPALNIMQNVHFMHAHIFHLMNF